MPGRSILDHARCDPASVNMSRVIKTPAKASEETCPAPRQSRSPSARTILAFTDQQAGTSIVNCTKRDPRLLCKLGPSSISGLGRNCEAKHQSRSEQDSHKQTCADSPRLGGAQTCVGGSSKRYARDRLLLGDELYCIGADLRGR
jgi:hypothetical protein